ncbi:MAG: hypothetical protein JO370_04075, partial [Paucibacter sp.]|nr:hypothetical protein [Roseateles sp.]
MAPPFRVRSESIQPISHPTLCRDRGALAGPSMQYAHTFLPKARHILLAACASAAMMTAQAQTAAAPASPSAPAVSPNDPRLPLVQRLLELWHVENVAITMVQRPAITTVEQAKMALQGRVSDEKQLRVMKDIAPDVQKYIDDATPIVKADAHQVVKETLTPLLLQNFNETELKQIIALLESPVKKKFEELVPSMEKALGERVVKDCATQITPLMQTMAQNVGT